MIPTTWRWEGRLPRMTEDAAIAVTGMQARKTPDSEALVRAIPKVSPMK